MNVDIFSGLSELKRKAADLLYYWRTQFYDRIHFTPHSQQSYEQRMGCIKQFKDQHLNTDLDIREAITQINDEGDLNNNLSDLLIPLEDLVELAEVLKRENEKLGMTQQGITFYVEVNWISFYTSLASWIGL